VGSTLVVVVERLGRLVFHIFAKDGDVTAGIFVVLFGVKRPAINANEMIAPADFAGVNFVRGSVIGHLLQNVRGDVLVQKKKKKNGWK
jgi:hypothetical protein